MYISEYRTLHIYLYKHNIPLFSHQYVPPSLLLSAFGQDLYLSVYLYMLLIYIILHIHNTLYVRTSVIINSLGIYVYVSHTPTSEFFCLIKEQ
jgi:hypothetical protein